MEDVYRVDGEGASTGGIPNAQLPAPMARDLFLSSQIDQASIASITKAIIEINKSDEILEKLYAVYGFTYKPSPINIYIDSYGGYVYQTFGLISVMEKSKTPVHTTVTGIAASGGFLILINGHKRFAHKYSTIMYHQVSSGAWGTLQHLKESFEETKRLQEVIEQMTIKRTNYTIAELNDIRERKLDVHLNAEQSLAKKCVDFII